MKIAFWGFCCVLVFSTPVFSGPPLQTNDTGTPGNRHWEINVGLSGEKTSSHFLLAIQAVDLNYGWGERIQLKYEVPWIFSNEEGGETQNGLGNSILGVKWRFLDEDRQGISMSTYPQVEFNTQQFLGGQGSGG